MSFDTSIETRPELTYALVERHLPLAGVPDVGGDGGQRVLARELRQDAKPVVEERQHGLACVAVPLDGDVRCLLVEGVLDELRDAFAWIRLATNELEGVVDADVQPTSELAAAMTGRVVVIELRPAPRASRQWCLARYGSGSASRRGRASDPGSPGRESASAGASPCRGRRGRPPRRKA